MKFLYCIACSMLLFSCVQQKEVPAVVDHISSEPISVSDKITGTSLEMPRIKIVDGSLDDLNEINVQWAAMIPYGFTPRGGSKVFFDTKVGYWWGESVEGTMECINIAKNAGLKVMIKPHVWVIGDGWPGGFNLSSNKKWKEWEVSYREYILTYARLADSMNVDLLCIGTEYRKAVVQRRQFWIKLIKEVREIYDGPITYAANWDNYKEVKFWEYLDYIGVDAYFPLSEEKDLSLNELKKNWAGIEKEMAAFSKKHNRRILFTEYGFKSIDYASAKNYGADSDTLDVNLNNQVVAYTAFFESIWQWDWMAGGFFWKWSVIGEKGGEANKRFTPQGKPTMDVIREWYGKVDN